VEKVQDELLGLIAPSLAELHLRADASNAKIAFATPLPAVAATFDVRPNWRVGPGGLPSLPLAFELKRVDASMPADERSQWVTIAVPLLRDAPVARRRFSKGSVVNCDDVIVKPVPVRRASSDLLAVPCALPEGITALRDVAVGDVVFADDVGPPFDVVADAPVTLRVTEGGFAVDITGLALSDARIGETTEVRLQHPARTFKARVVGRAIVQLLGKSNG
jgi:flagella basal body P-ring formation protein FlgA